MSNCIFCKIIAGEIPSHRLYEDEDVLIFLDASPNTTGHSLVVPKQHVERFDAASLEMLTKNIAVLRRFAPRLVRALGAEGFNLAVNTGAAAGQVVMHLHWHIIPRYTGDGLVHWHPKEGGTAELPDVARRIINDLSREPLV